MEVPEEMTIIAFLPGSFSVASFLISPHPKTSLVGMCMLKIGFEFIFSTFKVRIFKYSDS